MATVKETPLIDAVWVFWIWDIVENTEEKLFRSTKLMVTELAVDSREGGVVTLDIASVLANVALFTETETILPETPQVVVALFSLQLKPELITTGEGIKTLKNPLGLPEGIVKLTVNVAI